MKKILAFILLSVFTVSIFAQEETQKSEKSKPVRFTFGTGTLIDNQTVETPYKGGLELKIQHRFSLIENYHNLFGIYGSANTRIGLNYGITDRLMVGLGTERNNKLQDLQWKLLILQQKEDNSMPVSLSYFGNVVLNLQKEAAFGPVDRFKELHRLSYFNQLILARKFNNVLSLQVAPSVIYFNAVPQYSNELKYKNLNFALSAGAKATVTDKQSLILEYNQLLTKQDLAEQPKPSLSLGWEIGTATHSFQVFVENFDMIINQQSLLFNTNDYTKGKYLVGFNITVRF
jgi:hypothetical protein